MTIRKPAEQRKTEIIDAALGLADALGPDRLTTEAIAEKVGLTQPGIFRHFPTKQAIWVGVAERIAQLMGEGWQAALANREDPAGRLEALVLTQFRIIQTTPAIPAILFSRELHAENDMLRQTFLGLMRKFQTALTAEFQRGQASGRFRPDLEAGDAALMLIGLIQGVAIRWSLGGRTRPLAEEGGRLLAAHLRLFAAGALDMLNTETME
ncbi:TetR/AcrR family transcriptional regulator [Stappia indica]|uniref:TetR/AcrR family transcriptional regulator n=1 Tax=Stappia indica TaxID=538381 RepID=UPI001CD2FA4E|nr:TetR/AcrR family transcriptional regulator [Stappia indica]MCA1299191.1 TetR/AcrR family transcriptional regulator [Stappia indica]